MQGFLPRMQNGNDLFHRSVDVLAPSSFFVNFKNNHHMCKLQYHLINGSPSIPVMWTGPRSKPQCPQRSVLPFFVFESTMRILSPSSTIMREHHCLKEVPHLLLKPVFPLVSRTVTPPVARVKLMFSAKHEVFRAIRTQDAKILASFHALRAATAAITGIAFIRIYVHQPFQCSEWEFYHLGFFSEMDGDIVIPHDSNNTKVCRGSGTEFLKQKCSTCLDLCQLTPARNVEPESVPPPPPPPKRGWGC